MYITTGNILSLLSWFGSSGYEFLCLFVAGSLDDAKFFQEVFAKKEPLNTISGKKVAIFLFANEQEHLIETQEERGIHTVIPGKMISQGLIGPIFRYWHISELPERNRDNVIRASQNIALDICEWFGLPVDDIPCILIISSDDIPYILRMIRADAAIKNRPFRESSPARAAQLRSFLKNQSFVIPTRGETDLQVFFEFFKALNKLATSLSNASDRLISAEKVKKQLQHERDKQELATAEETALKARTDLNQAYHDFHKILENYGIPHEIIAKIIGLDLAGPIQKKLRGAIHLPEMPKPYRVILNRALNETEFLEVCYKTNQLEKSAPSAYKQVEKLRKAVRSFDKTPTRPLAITSIEKALKEIEKTHREYDRIQQEIIDLANKYERKFYRRSILRPLKEFVLGFVGVTERVQKLVSLEESIKKIIKGL